MKKAAKLWDFCLYLLGAFTVPFFTKLQSLIASCDTEIFCIVGAVIAYAAISAIKE